MRGNFRVCNLSVAVFYAVEDSPAQQPVKLRVMPVTFGSGGIQEARKGGTNSKISFYSAIFPVDGRNGCNGRDPSVGPSWLSPRRTGDPQFGDGPDGSKMEVCGDYSSGRHSVYDMYKVFWDPIYGYGSGP
ncbi:hypothetical protein DFH09DRAFT_1107467 [Mycena vulgaris]|nr:hypothetical protein DFH09DRAFT_1107467 [Mycena vulgaris]